MKLKYLMAYSFGAAGSAVFGFLTLFFMAWYIPKQEIGLFSFFQTLVNLLVIVVPMGLDQAYVREYHEKYNKRSLFYITLFPVLIVFCMLSVGGSFYANEISRYAFSRNDPNLILWLYIASFSSIMIRYFALVVRMEENVIAYSLSQLLPKIVLLLFVIALPFFKFSYVDGLTLSILYTVSLLFTLTYFVAVKFELIKYAVRAEIGSSKEFSTLFKYSFPLMLSGLAFWGLTAMDRLFISKLSSFEELASYSVAITFVSGVLLLQTVFSTVWIPLVFKAAAKKREQKIIQRGIDIFTVLLVIIWGVVSILSYLIPKFLPSAYKDIDLIVISSLSYPILLIMTDVTSLGINLSKRTFFSFLSTIVAVLFNVILNFCLIKKYGALGAAVATSLSFYVYFATKTYFAFRYHYKFSFIKGGGVITICVALSLSPLVYDLSPLIILVSLFSIIAYKYELTKYWSLYTRFKRLKKIRA